jgi:hypothetical protein
LNHTIPYTATVSSYGLDQLVLDRLSGASDSMIHFSGPDMRILGQRYAAAHPLAKNNSFTYAGTPDPSSYNWACNGTGHVEYSIDIGGTAATFPLSSTANVSTITNALFTLSPDQYVVAMATVFTPRQLASGATYATLTGSATSRTNSSM